MSNFRTKILGLAALATAFAGLSYGQGTITCAPPGLAAPTAAGVGANPTLRAESETELVSDFQLPNCVVTVAPTAATVYAVLSTPVTSKSESPTAAQIAAGLTANSDAVLQIACTLGPCAIPFSYVAGTVSGLTVTFAVPAGDLVNADTYTLTVSNIRVNATLGGAPQVTESMLISYANAGGSTVNVASTALNVGYVLSSLSFAISKTPTNIVTCTGQTFGTSGTTLPAPNFTVTINELISGAFRIQGTTAVPGATGGEDGSYYSAAATSTTFANTGAATQATQITLTFANVPAAATLYLPLTVGALTISGGTVATSPTAVVGQNLVAFTPTNGTVTAVYSPTAVTTTGAYPIPVIVIVAANAAPVQTAMTVVVSYAPAVALASGTLPTLIPTFAVATTAASSTISVTSCATTLLFPYVTNVSGFETGIAIANTTTDNLGTAGKTVATPVSGSCTLNFYGNTATQPTAVVTPTLGASTVAAPTVAPVYANTLTAASGVTGFTGYAIASCNFTQAHGFAFITDLTGQFSGAMGYVAVVVPNTRGEAAGGVCSSVSSTVNGAVPPAVNSVSCTDQTFVTNQ
jgi:hypothetical protein